MKRTHLIQAVEGGVQEIARVLGISHQAVYAWPEDVPELRVFQLKQRKPAWIKKAQWIASAESAPEPAAAGG